MLITLSGPYAHIQAYADRLSLVIEAIQTLRHSELSAPMGTAPIPDIEVDRALASIEDEIAPFLSAIDDLDVGATLWIDC